jgi:uncharacterized protein with GYD domain
MTTLITRGRFTQDYVKALTTAPEDREPAVRKLVEAIGAKFLNFYFTTGETDFLLITETDDPDSVIAALLAAAAAGTISGVTTSKAWTAGELKKSRIERPKQRRRIAPLARRSDLAPDRIPEKRWDNIEIRPDVAHRW